jgi:hypothetical protein
LTIALNSIEKKNQWYVVAIQTNKDENKTKRQKQKQSKNNYAHCDFPRYSKCGKNICNILKYCSQALDIHGQRVLQLIFILFMTL